MLVSRTPSDISETLEGSCVTIGNFDGVHVGHQRLLTRVRDRAQALGLISVAVSFDPHPLRVIRGKTPPFITMTPQKLKLIGALGLNAVLLLEFTRAMGEMSPEEFVRSYLVQGLRMRELVVGYDYAFGKGRSGNFEVLKELGAKYDYGVERLEPVIVGDAIVSSTRIRDMIQAGEVWEARPLLSRFYQVAGEVIHGHNRGGRLLGFPTANLKLVDELFPKTGVYAVWAEVDGRMRPAVANIGHNPTFGEEALSVEVHIMDFSADLYGRDLTVHFVQRIRAERKFSSLDELKARINLDADLGRRILAEPEAKAAPAARPELAFKDPGS